MTASRVYFFTCDLLYYVMFCSVLFWEFRMCQIHSFVRTYSHSALSLSFKSKCHSIFAYIVREHNFLPFLFGTVKNEFFSPTLFQFLHICDCHSSFFNRFTHKSHLNIDVLCIYMSFIWFMNIIFVDVVIVEAHIVYGQTNTHKNGLSTSTLHKIK